MRGVFFYLSWSFSPQRERVCKSLHLGPQTEHGKTHYAHLEAFKGRTKQQEHLTSQKMTAINTTVQ